MSIREKLGLTYDNLVAELAETDQRYQEAVRSAVVFQSVLNAAELVSLSLQLAPLDLVKGIGERDFDLAVTSGILLIFTPINVIGYPLQAAVRALGNKVTNSDMFY